MGWIREFRLLMKTNVQALLERFEDPERVLQQLVIDMEEELERVKGSVAEALADEHQLGRRVEEAEEEVVRWRTRAEVALQQGNDDLARRALERKLLAETRRDRIAEEFEKHRGQTRGLRASVQELEEKIQEARHRRTLLLARFTRAESGRRIEAALEGRGSSSAFAKFRDLERRVERSEAVLGAWRELDGDPFPSDELSAAFEKEEFGGRLEAELEELRQRLAEDD